MKLFSRWKTLFAILLIAGLGLAIHMTPMQQQSPCDPGFFEQVQAAVIPSAEAADGCTNFCPEVGCSFGGTWCDSCYDGDWTFCVEPEPH